jgi:hypothetical protein
MRFCSARVWGKGAIMKTLSMIRFKPKPEYFDEYLTALKDALRGHEHYLLTRDEEIFQIWVTDGIDDLADFQDAGLSFLDEHRHMLKEYSEGSHSIPITAFVEQEPTSGGIKSFNWSESPKFNDPKYK